MEVVYSLNLYDNKKLIIFVLKKVIEKCNLKPTYVL